MKKAMAIFLAALFLLTACAPVDNGESSAPDGDTSSPDVSSEDTSSADTNQNKRDDFVPVFRFVAASDSHVNVYETKQADRLKKMFETAYAYAETSTYKNLDAVIMVGDLTDNGTAAEFKLYNDAVKAAIKDGTTLLTVMGNHEYYQGGQATYTANVDENLDKHVEINGYHFIGLSTRADNEYTDEQIAWLETEMAAAAESGKPIFTFQHHHIKDTVYVSTEWYANASAKLDAIYKKYSQTVNFSGHSHAPINNPTSFVQTDYTLVGTGTLNYFEMTTGMTVGTLVPGKENAAQYWIVEAGEKGDLLIRPYNILTDDFFKNPYTGEYIEYYIADPFNKDTFEYGQKRLDANQAPYFEDGATVTVSDITKSKVTVTVPQAKDDQCVYGYYVQCGTQSTAYFSEYYFEPMPETISFDLINLKPGTEYTITVTPGDAFGVKGEPITATFTTEASSGTAASKPLTDATTFADFEGKDLKEASGSVAYGGKADGAWYCGNWNASGKAGGSAKIVDGKGYNGSAAIGVTTDTIQNQGLYIFGNGTVKSGDYLIFYADFSDVDFRKACFGVIKSDGSLFDTDDEDGRSDQYLYYRADGAEEWTTMTHGEDGCFGSAQSSSVKGYKGLFAVPVGDFAYRWGTGSGGSLEGDIVGVYMYWDFTSETPTGTYFYLDQFGFTDDYSEY